MRPYKRMINATQFIFNTKRDIVIHNNNTYILRSDLIIFTRVRVWTDRPTGGRQTYTQTEFFNTF